MIVRYCTKRDINGNTYKLVIDTNNRTYARENNGFFHRSDFIEISKRDYRKQVNELLTTGYREVNSI